jgi:hypothetical protein
MDLRIGRERATRRRRRKAEKRNAQEMSATLG